MSNYQQSPLPSKLSSIKAKTSIKSHRSPPKKVLVPLYAKKSPISIETKRNRSPLVTLKEKIPSIRHTGYFSSRQKTLTSPSRKKDKKITKLLGKSSIIEKSNASGTCEHNFESSIENRKLFNLVSNCANQGKKLSLLNSVLKKIENAKTPRDTN